MTGLDQLTGDLSESTVKRQLLAVANSTTRRLALHWSGDARPEAVRLLQAVRETRPQAEESG